MQNHVDLTAFLVPQLEELKEAGYADFYDIPLGCLTREVLSAVSAPAWCLPVVDSPMDSWLARIAIEEPTGPARSFYEELQQYAPISLVVSDGSAWWRVRYPKEHYEWNWFLLGPRFSIEESTSIMNRLQDRRFEQAIGLMIYLNGFREDFAPSGGYINDPRDAALLYAADIESVFGDFEFKKEWDPSLHLFTARNGDALLVSHSGNCGWCELGSESGITPFAETLDEGVNKWIRFRARFKSSPHDDEYLDRPFDSRSVQ